MLLEWVRGGGLHSLAPPCPCSQPVLFRGTHCGGSYPESLGGSPEGAGGIRFPEEEGVLGPTAHGCWDERTGKGYAPGQVCTRGQAVFPALLHADLCPPPAPGSAVGMRKAQRLGWGDMGAPSQWALRPRPASGAPSIPQPCQPFQSFPSAAGRHEGAAMGRERAHRPPPGRGSCPSTPKRVPTLPAPQGGHRRPLVAARGQSGRARPLGFQVPEFFSGS